MEKPSLFIVPSFIGSPSLDLIPPFTLDSIYKLKHFIVEREKTARAFLKSLKHPTPQNDFVFFELDKHNDYMGFELFAKEKLQTTSVGIISESGYPCIADPGYKVVQYCHKQNFSVTPLSGDSSIFLALSCSGLLGQKFTFHGYLDRDADQRKKQLQEMESQTPAAQIFMETPYRNQQLIKQLKKWLSPETKLSICAGLQTEKQWIRTRTVGKWNIEQINIDKIPAIFIIG